MSLYRPDGETQVNLYQWAPFEYFVDGVKTYHVVGRVGTDGRVCSPIKDFEETETDWIFTTRSGKKYVCKKDDMVDSKSLSTNTNYVLNYWLKFNGGMDYITFCTPEDIKKHIIWLDSNHV